jgi:phosphoglycolate phosphatase-like HAD superfamily hydrolase
VITAPLRIAFDMDGTLADLSSAYAAVEESLFGAADEEAKHPAPEVREQEQQAAGAEGAAPAEGERIEDDRRATTRVRKTRNRDRVWKAIEEIPDFWTTLKPLEAGAVERLYKLTGELNWEVFFITQRPATAGGTVQRQTHKWLVEQGFSTPSVIPLSGGRGKAAAALFKTPRRTCST